MDHLGGRNRTASPAPDRSVAGMTAQEVIGDAAADGIEL
jgi:hypothetical protein